MSASSHSIEDDVRKEKGTGAAEHSVNILDEDDVQKEEGTGSAEHSSEDDDEVWLPSILKVDQVDEVVSSARTSNLSLPSVHKEARSVLVNATKRIHENGVDEVQVLGDWEHWKEYVCMHDEHADIIGRGILRVVAQAVRGTKDYNREGRPRVDLVFYRRDGSYMRVHPGSCSKGDAQLVLSPPSASEHGATAVNQWTRIWADGGVFTIGDARLVPQNDRIGRKEAWRILSALGDQTPLDLTDGTRFAWWLWVSSFDAKMSQVIQRGLCKAELSETRPRMKLLTFGRFDETVVHVGLVQGKWHLELWVWLNGKDGPPDL